MAKMIVAQVPNAGADFEIVEGESQSRGRDRSGSASRRAMSVTAMSSPRKAAGRVSRTRACRGTKSPA
jgi:hypothetical protein